jgi:hypothetical protein
MPIENFIIHAYCLVAEIFEEVVDGVKLRKRGSSPSLSDEEAITLLVVGEYLGFGSDKRIWQYFRTHWQSWFPGLGCRTSFTRQSANLCHVQDNLRTVLSRKMSASKDLFLFDGFPIPVCHIKRYKRSKLFGGEGAVGYCAAKDEHYFGFKGHIIITSCGAIRSIEVAAANIDERDMLPETSLGLTGDIIADKGLIRPELMRELAGVGLRLHTPLRKNMNDPRPKSFVKQLMNIRRVVETVIGQLTERFKIQAIRAKDTWHLMAKITRKMLAHTVCFAINKTINPDNPLQIDGILQP